MTLIKSRFSKGLASIRGRSGLASSSTHRSGSVLVYALIVLSLVLIVTLGISAATIIERKTSSTTAKSTIAFQVADSCIEIVRARINSSTGDTIIKDTFSDMCNADETITPSSFNADKKCYVSLYDTLDTNQPPMGCKSSAKISIIKSVRSIGIYSNTTRAAEVALAAASTYKGCISCSINNGAGMTPCTMKDQGGTGKNLCNDNNGCTLRLISAPTSASPKPKGEYLFYQSPAPTNGWVQIDNPVKSGTNGDATSDSLWNSTPITSFTLSDDAGGCTLSADNLCANNASGSDITLIICD